MKYLVITEWCPEETDALLQAMNKMEIDRDRNPDKHPKTLMPGYMPLTELPRLTEHPSCRRLHIAEATEE